MLQNLRVSLGARACVCVWEIDEGGTVSFVRPGPIFREACSNTVCSIPDSLRALAKSRKATISFVISIHVDNSASPWTFYHEIRYLRIFRKFVQEVQVWLESEKNNGYFKWRPMYIYDIWPKPS
jgi:hypothetical protein